MWINIGEAFLKFLTSVDREISVMCTPDPMQAGVRGLALHFLMLSLETAETLPLGGQCWHKFRSLSGLRL